MPDPAPGRVPGVRVRILVTVLVLAAAGMAVAGTVLTLAQRRQVFEDATRTVTADTLELSAFAAADRSATDVRSLLVAALQRQGPADHETLLALVDGRPQFVVRGTQALETSKEAALMAAVRSLPADAPARVRTTRTSNGPVVWSAVQVRVAGRPEAGTLVVAVAVRSGLARVDSGARLYALLSLVTLAAVASVGWAVAGRLLEPLRRLRSAAEELSATDLGVRVPVTGRDDVSALARTVNAMLDRLQQGFRTQQTFLDDAGHELRTPLTVVRGHLELLDAADPDDVAQTRSLVLDEVDRMARLVDDLTVLAKAGRPDFLRPEPTDTDRLVLDVVEKAEALGARRWTVDDLPGRTAQVDPQRLTQALLQLAVNAVQHTADGAEIRDGTLRLWVRDTGPGVAPEARGRIFERFQGSGHGSGLGLSIVAGIATAHGGRADVGDAAGGGAVFTVHLPTSVLEEGR
jgi:signal transduction histidine kinase